MLNTLGDAVGCLLDDFRLGSLGSLMFSPDAKGIGMAIGITLVGALGGFPGVIDESSLTSEGLAMDHHFSTTS